MIQALRLDGWLKVRVMMKRCSGLSRHGMHIHVKGRERRMSKEEGRRGV